MAEWSTERSECRQEHEPCLDHTPWTAGPWSRVHWAHHGMGEGSAACLAYYRRQTISKDPDTEVGTSKIPGCRGGLCLFYFPTCSWKIISVSKIGFEELNSKAHNLMPRGTPTVCFNFSGM